MKDLFNILLWLAIGFAAFASFIWVGCAVSPESGFALFGVEFCAFFVYLSKKFSV